MVFRSVLTEKHAFLTTDSSLLPARLIGLSLGFVTYRGAAVSDESARRSEELAGKSHKSAGSFRCVYVRCPQLASGTGSED